MQLSWPSHKLTLKLSCKKEYLRTCTRPSWGQLDPSAGSSASRAIALLQLTHLSYVFLLALSRPHFHFQVHFAEHSFHCLLLFFLYTCIICPGAWYEVLIAGSRCHLNQNRVLITGIQLVTLTMELKSCRTLI